MYFDLSLASLEILEPGRPHQESARLGDAAVQHGVERPPLLLQVLARLERTACYVEIVLYHVMVHIL